mgnify:CR=1 FL=1
MEDRFFWLDGWEGKAKGGYFYRSRIALDIAEFEEKFKKKVVALGIEKDYSSGKPSWNLNMVIETDEDEE